MNHLCHSHLANNVLVEKAMIAILRLFPHCVPRTHLDKSNCSRVSLFKDYQSKKNVPRATERYYRSNKKLLPEQQKSNTRATKNITRAAKNITRATKKYCLSHKKILPEQRSTACSPPSTQPRRSSSPLQMENHQVLVKSIH